jgi:biopolymer transport protein ExbD
MIRFHCHHCQKMLSVPDEAVGKRGKCPGCGSEIVVPKAAPALPPAPIPLVPAKSTEKPKPKTPKKSPPSFSSLMGPKKDLSNEDWIDMTAMVDIVFFLLIFFLVTSLVAHQAAIQFPTPENRKDNTSAATSAKSVAEFEKDNEFVIVRVDAEDTVWVDDSTAPSAQEVVSKLRNAGGAGSQVRVLVLTHGDSHYGTAVMVLDAAQEAGIQDIRLAVQNDEG